MIALAPIMPSDHDAVEWLYDLAFGPGRQGLSSYRLREGVPDIANLARKAIDEDGTLCGAIRFWPVRVGDCAARQLLLGPVAVHPTRQGEGIGYLLITAGIQNARASGCRGILLVGDEPYYGRFGFRRAAAITMPPPTNPDRTLLLDLADDALPPLTGAVRPWHRADARISTDTVDDEPDRGSKMTI